MLVWQVFGRSKCFALLRGLFLFNYHFQEVLTVLFRSFAKRYLVCLNCFSETGHYKSWNGLDDYTLAADHHCRSLRLWKQFNQNFRL